MIKPIRKNCIWALTILGILCAVFVLYGYLYGAKKPQAIVSYKDIQIQVSIADTPTLREQGLSGTASLAPGTGMFFIFEKPDNYGFWMKDMLYPIDIVWLDSDFRIVHIEENVTPATYPAVFYPHMSAQYVLELPQGDARRYNFVQGAQLQFKKRYF